MFIAKKYGKLVFLESSSIKQPIENLVLSNSFRLAVAGYVKTMSQELAGLGITLNILAPGFHETEAIKRILVKKSEQTGLSSEEIKLGMIHNTPVQQWATPKTLRALPSGSCRTVQNLLPGKYSHWMGGSLKGAFKKDHKKTGRENSLPAFL
jgi:3-oxoacyl-[acyl-carrier protein] reductase